MHVLSSRKGFTSLKCKCYLLQCQSPIHLRTAYMGGRHRRKEKGMRREGSESERDREIGEEGSDRERGRGSKPGKCGIREAEARERNSFLPQTDSRPSADKRRGRGRRRCSMPRAADAPGDAARARGAARSLEVLIPKSQFGTYQSQFLNIIHYMHCTGRPLYC